MHVNSVQGDVGRSAGEAAAQQIDFVTLVYYAAEYFVQMQLRATSMRVLTILPVDDEDAQRSEHALLARVRVEHSVHEARALLAPVTFCKPD